VVVNPMLYLIQINKSNHEFTSACDLNNIHTIHTHTTSGIAANCVKQDSNYFDTTLGLCD